MNKKISIGVAILLVAVGAVLVLRLPNSSPKNSSDLSIHYTFNPKTLKVGDVVAGAMKVTNIGPFNKTLPMSFEENSGILNYRVDFIGDMTIRGTVETFGNENIYIVTLDSASAARLPKPQNAPDVARSFIIDKSEVPSITKDGSLVELEIGSLHLSQYPIDISGYSARVKKVVNVKEN